MIFPRDFSRGITKKPDCQFKSSYTVAAPNHSFA